VKLHAPNKISYLTAIVFGFAGIYGEFSGDFLNQGFFYENRAIFLFIGFIGLAVAPLIKIK